MLEERFGGFCDPFLSTLSLLLCLVSLLCLTITIYDFLDIADSQSGELNLREGRRLHT